MIAILKRLNNFCKAYPTERRPIVIHEIVTSAVDSTDAADLTNIQRVTIDHLFGICIEVSQPNCKLVTAITRKREVTFILIKRSSLLDGRMPEIDSKIEFEFYFPWPGSDDQLRIGHATVYVTITGMAQINELTISEMFRNQGYTKILFRHMLIHLADEGLRLDTKRSAQAGSITEGLLETILKRHFSFYLANKQYRSYENAIFATPSPTAGK